MSRAYTVAEIDALRQLCESKYLFGTFFPKGIGFCGRSFRESDKILAVEEMVRTYMLAGITANDIQQQANQE
jgi:hypothetical protein